ncbi:hypothetical protein J3P96_07620 [Pseudomonas sp. R3-56]|uniref:NEL-type E3 ubiquitin ligase domain-containing protein n=1 Tax=Pseudomonas sp. R3-56 TaxID=2817401 RepID=UPI003DA955E2
MTTTQSKVHLDQIVADLYARHLPNVTRAEFPPMAEQALILLARLVELLAPFNVAPERWADRHFITVLGTQAAVRQEVARLQAVAVDGVDPFTVRKVLGQLSLAAWEGLAPELAYPVETPHPPARAEFRQALIEQLKAHSRRPLSEHAWVLLANLADDLSLRNQQQAWVRTLGKRPSPIQQLTSATGLLALLQEEISQAFTPLARLDSLEDFEQVAVTEHIAADAQPHTLASIIYASFAKARVFNTDDAYELTDKRPGQLAFRLTVKGSQLNAFAARIQAFGDGQVLEADFATLAEAYRQRFVLQARLACADAVVGTGDFQTLREVSQIRGATVLHGEDLTVEAEGRIHVTALYIEMPDGSRQQLHGVLVIGTRRESSVMLVAPHLGIEPFAHLKALRVELERRFNDPGLFRPWLGYIQARERAQVGFHDPGATKLCRYRQLSDDVFEHLAQSNFQRLRSDLEQAYRHVPETGSLDELGQRIDRLLTSETTWSTEALALRTLRAAETLDLEPLLQACHLQVHPDVALPLQGQPEPVSLMQVFPGQVADHQAEPITDNVHAARLAAYFGTAEIAKITARLFEALPDHFPTSAATAPSLARCLARRLWAAQATPAELAWPDQGGRHKVFHFQAGLLDAARPATPHETLAIANTLLPSGAPADSCFSCADWIDAQLVTQNWRRTVVHRHIGGGTAMPDVEALCTVLEAPRAFDYSRASPHKLAEEINPLLDALIDSPAFERLQQALLKPAGWPANTDPERCQALALSALTDYLYPPETHRAGYLCGFNLYDPALGDRTWQQVLDALWGHLRNHFTRHSEWAGSLAAVMLLRRYAPAFLVRGLPPTLLYGHTQTAVDFRHAVALAQATVPGLAWRKRFTDLEALWANVLTETLTQAQQAACAALRNDASIYFAMCRGHLSAGGLDEVADDDAQKAIKFTHADSERREKNLNALLEPPPDRKEMARAQIKIDAPGVDQDKQRLTSLEEKRRFDSILITLSKWIGSWISKEWDGPYMSDVERYMTNVEGYGLNDEELGFQSRELGGPALSARFEKAYDRFEQASDAAQREKMIDAILDLPAHQRRELMAADRLVSVSFKDSEGKPNRLGHFGVLALGDGYAYELFCPSGTVRKVVLEIGADARVHRYYGSTVYYPGKVLEVYDFSGLPALDATAYIEGREGLSREQGGKLTYLFDNPYRPRRHQQVIPERQAVEGLCKLMQEHHFGQVVRQLRPYYRRRTPLEIQYQRWHRELDVPLSFIVPFYSLYLDIKHNQVGTATVLFAALEVITFLLPFNGAFRSGYTASVTLGRVVARTTSLVVSKVALRLAKTGVASAAFSKVLLIGTLEALNPMPWGLFALVGRAGWKGVRVLNETLWRLRQLHWLMEDTFALAYGHTRHIWRTRGLLAPHSLRRLPAITRGPVDTVAVNFRADFSWGNRKLSIAQQIDLHARDVDISGAVLQDHLYRLGDAEYISMQGNLYQVHRSANAQLRISRGEHSGPLVEYAKAEQQWRLAQGGLAGGMLPAGAAQPPIPRQVTLPMDGVEGAAPDFQVRIAVQVIYDAAEGGWRERRGGQLGAMLWRNAAGEWQRGTLIEFRNRPALLAPPGNLRTVELPALPAMPMQLEPVPAVVHYLWLGRDPLGRDALVNMAFNARQAPGFQSILHVDLEPAALQQLVTEAGELMPGLVIRNLNDELFFQNLSGTPLGEQYRHITGAALPYYPAASHVLRYPLLNAYGGIYLDVDSAILISIPPGQLVATDDGLLLGNWVRSALGSGYEPSHFASRPDNRILQAISLEMTQRYQAGRAHYDSIAPRDTRQHLQDFYREHSRLTGTGLFNDVLAQTPAYPLLPQMGLADSFGIYDPAYERSAFEAAMRHFPFATLHPIQPTRVPNWRQALSRFEEPLPEARLLEHMRALHVPGDSGSDAALAALATLRAQGRSAEAIAQTLSTMGFQRARMNEALERRQRMLSVTSPARIEEHRDLHAALMAHWQADAWATELNLPPAVLQLGNVPVESLVDLPPCFYSSVHGLRLGPGVRWLNREPLSRFNNLSRLEIDCSDLMGFFVPPPQHVPQLLHLSLLNMHDAARHLNAIRRITTLQILDLTGARGLTPPDNAILDLSDFGLRSIILDGCRLQVFPIVDFSATEQLSLVNNRIDAIPAGLLANPSSAARHIEVRLEGNPLPQQVRARVLFANGENRRYRFFVDDRPLPGELRRQVQTWQEESLRIRQVFTEWAQASSSTTPVPDTVRVARERLGARMFEAHQRYRSSGQGATLALELLTELPPDNLPAQAYQAVHDLEIRRPGLGHHELGQLIKRFQAVRSLIISSPTSPIARLPETISSLPELMWLELTNLGIEIDQPAIELFASVAHLMHLNLGGNRLGAIDNTTALANRFGANAGLYLSRMHIEQFPRWIDAHLLSSLEELDLSENLLTHIPEDVFSNEGNHQASTEVVLAGNPLDPELSQRLLDSMAAVQPGIPRFTFELDDLQLDHFAQPGPVPTPSVDPWLEGLDELEAARRRQLWQDIGRAGASNLMTMINQLRQTNDFFHAARRPELIGSVWTVLEQAGNDAVLRRRLNDMAEEGARMRAQGETCVDGLRVEFARIETEAMVHQALPAGMPEEQRGAWFYQRLRAKYRADAVEVIANRQAGGRDVAEVRMAYLIGTREPLGLLVAPGSMAFAGAARIRHGELSRVVQIVLEEERLGGLLNYGQLQPFWTQYLRERYAARFARLETEYRQRVLDIDDVYPADNPEQRAAHLQEMVSGHEANQQRLISELTAEEGNALHPPE